MLAAFIQVGVLGRLVGPCPTGRCKLLWVLEI